MAAAYHGHTPVLVFLLHNGASMDLQDKAGWTAMMWASANDQVEVIEYLFNENASMKPSKGGWSPILAAAAAGEWRK